MHHGAHFWARYPRRRRIRAGPALRICGVVTALVSKGVLPLPVTPTTGFALGSSGGQPVATYRFPIYRGNPDLSGPSGDILHLGGIDFLGARGKHLSIRNFDIDLVAGKVFANRVNGAKAHVAILDLDLAGLTVVQKDGATILNGIKVNLDADAATALNATFSGRNLPAGLAFGNGAGGHQELTRVSRHVSGQDTSAPVSSQCATGPGLNDVGDQARVTLPAFRQDVHTEMRRRVPGATSARTVCTFGFQRRWVRRWEWDTDMPKPGPLPQTSQMLAMSAS